MDGDVEKQKQKDGVQLPLHASKEKFNCTLLNGFDLDSGHVHRSADRCGLHDQGSAPYGRMNDRSRRYDQHSDLARHSDGHCRLLGLLRSKKTK